MAQDGDLDRLLRGVRQFKHQGSAGYLRGKKADAENAEELDVSFLRNAVEPVDHRLGEEGEYFQQGNARIAWGVISPVRAGQGDPPQTFFDQLAEGSVVEIRRG